MTAHTADEALSRFKLVKGSGGSEQSGEACAMTALAWVAGAAWTDHPECAHPLLANWAIKANDDDATTPAQRADIVRAGERGILDTWWVPTTVIVGFSAKVAKDASPFQRIVAVAKATAAWKASESKARANLVRADLGDADLGDAYLRGANLRGANLVRADLGDAYLRGADLRGADLVRAYLGDAYLVRADLRGADLRGADLRGANLRGADLVRADLGDAYLRGADLRGADLRGANLVRAYLGGADLRDAYANTFTTPPDGWKVVDHRLVPAWAREDADDDRPTLAELAGDEAEVAEEDA